MMVSELERRRRDLKSGDPELYAYIADLEAAKALDSAGGTVSGAVDQFEAANRVWALSAARRARAVKLDDATSPRGQQRRLPPRPPPR